MLMRSCVWMVDGVWAQIRLFECVLSKMCLSFGYRTPSPPPPAAATSSAPHWHINYSIWMYSFQINRDGKEIEINVCKNKGRVETDYAQSAVKLFFKSNASCGSGGKQTFPIHFTPNLCPTWKLILSDFSYYSVIMPWFPSKWREADMHHFQYCIHNFHSLHSVPHMVSFRMNILIIVFQPTFQYWQSQQ